MQTVKNTNIKHISKVREYESCDATDIIYDVMDWTRAESVKNGTVISRQKGSRRIIDRNTTAHAVTDYSEFKVTKIESGVTVDNSKKEKQLEDEALKLLADLGISWDDEEEMEDEDQQESDEQDQQVEPEQVETEQPEQVETDSDRIEDEESDSEDEEMPDDFDSLIASIVGTDDDNDDDDSDCDDDDDWGDDEDEMPEQFESLIDELMATC